MTDIVPTASWDINGRHFIFYTQGRYDKSKSMCMMKNVPRDMFIGHR